MSKAEKKQEKRGSKRAAEEDEEEDEEDEEEDKGEEMVKKPKTDEALRDQYEAEVRLDAEETLHHLLDLEWAACVPAPISAEEAMQKSMKAVVKDINDKIKITITTMREAIGRQSSLGLFSFAQKLPVVELPRFLLNFDLYSYSLRVFRRVFPRFTILPRPDDGNYIIVSWDPMLK